MRWLVTGPINSFTNACNRANISQFEYERDGPNRHARRQHGKVTIESSPEKVCMTRLFAIVGHGELNDRGTRIFVFTCPFISDRTEVPRVHSLCSVILLTRPRGTQ